ncbi:MAG: V-type ATP synthase subunit F [Nitrospirota bacterium]
MKKIVFITPPGAKPGFALAGVRQMAVEEKDAGKALEEAVAEPDTGVVALEERLFRKIGERAVRELQARWEGLITVLPAPERAGIGAEEYLEELVRRAVGYHVRVEL